MTNPRRRVIHDAIADLQGSQSCQCKFCTLSRRRASLSHDRKGPSGFVVLKLYSKQAPK